MILILFDSTSLRSTCAYFHALPFAPTNSCNHFNKVKHHVNGLHYRRKLHFTACRAFPLSTFTLGGTILHVLHVMLWEEATFFFSPERPQLKNKMLNDLKRFLISWTIQSQILKRGKQTWRAKRWWQNQSGSWGNFRRFMTWWWIGKLKPKNKCVYDRDVHQSMHDLTEHFC